MPNEESFDLYKKYNDMFLADFWNTGNENLNIAIEPRSNVESGVWFVATWKTEAGSERRVTAQKFRLLWERIILQFLRDYERDKPSIKHPVSELPRGG